jgi:predicted metal-binding protein
VFDKHASNKQSKRMDFAQIAVDVATFAYKNRCCSKNCILELVKQFTTDKVAEAVHLARKNVYHTNANHAHSELRHLLQFGSNGIDEVCAYFEHMKTLSTDNNTPE